MIQRSQQHPHVRQIEFVRRRLRQLVPQRKHAGYCGFVGHKEALSYQPSARQLDPQIIKLEDRIRRAWTDPDRMPIGFADG